MVGGLFTDHLSWRWAFYVNLPIGVVVIVMAAFTVPSVRAKTRPVIDYLGIVFVSLGAAGLTLALSWGGTQYAWGSATIIGLFVASIVSLGIFVLVEARADDPILPLHLFRSSVFSVCVGAGVHRRVRHARRDDVPADLPAVRARGLGDLVRAADAADGHRAAGDLDPSGTVVGRTGQYKIFPIAGPPDDRGRAVPAVDDGCAHAVLDSRLFMLVLGSASGCACRC